MSSLYISPDSELSTLGFLVLFVCFGFVGVTFTILSVFKPEAWRRNILLGVAAAALLVIAGFLLIGPGTVQDSDAQWACPTALQGIQLEPSPGSEMPEGIAECRTFSQRNAVLAGIATASGVAITLGAIVAHRKNRIRSRAIRSRTK